MINTGTCTGVFSLRWVLMRGTIVVALDDERIRCISACPVIRLRDAVDFLALLLPRGQEVGGEDVADRVMHHVEVIEDICDLGIVPCEPRAEFSRHRHERPLDRRLLQVAVVGGENGLDGLLFGREILGRCQRVIHDDLQIVVRPNRRVKQRKLLSKRARVGQLIQPAMVETFGGNGIRALPIKVEDLPQGGVFIGKIRHVNIVGRPMQRVRFIEGILRLPGQFHVRRGNGFLIRIERWSRRDEPERFLSSLLFNRGYILAPGQQQMLIEIGMPEINAVELNIKLLQIFSQGEVPERSIVEALIPLLELSTAERRESDQGDRHEPSHWYGVLHGHVCACPLSYRNDFVKSSAVQRDCSASQPFTPGF
jgi:hypothetical protein